MSMIVQQSERYAGRDIRYGGVNKSASNANLFHLSDQTEDEKALAGAKETRTTAKGNSFDSLAPNAPGNVKDAWEKAEQETGTNGFGKGADGKLTHISAMRALQIEQRLTKGHSDFLGDTKESAIEAAQRALDRMTSSLWASSSAGTAELHTKEKGFYEAFLKNLGEID